jgi:hypothetical protein
MGCHVQRRTALRVARLASGRPLRCQSFDLGHVAPVRCGVQSAIGRDLLG